MMVMIIKSSPVIIKSFVLAAVIAALAAAPVRALADCTLVPNGTTILTPETRPAGTVIYNSDHHVFQGCVEDHWVSLHVSAAAAAAHRFDGPADCPAIGDLCADGTVFAGYHPTLHEALFIPPTDQGTTSQWKTSIGTDDIATDSTYDGRANTNQVANSTTFPAFKACKDLGTGGHSDWYLPSQVELYYLWAVHETIEAGGNITNFQNAYYWSSTEYDTGVAWLQLFTDSTVNHFAKTYASGVRCVRR